jgi:hypothetical protein
MTDTPTVTREPREVTGAVQSQLFGHPFCSSLIVTNPTNAYTARLSLFQPGATLASLRPVGTLRTRLRYSVVPTMVLALLTLFEVPILRRVIEAILVNGIPPDTVTKALRDLRESSSVWWKPTVFAPKQKTPDHVYGMREPTASENVDLRDLYLRRERMLAPSVVKEAGERYVRAALGMTGRYGEITQRPRHEQP